MSSQENSTSSSFLPLRLFKRGEDHPMQASKWLTLQALLDVEEMAALFQELEPFALYQVSGVMKHGEGLIPKSEFLAVYSKYIEALKQGKIPSDEIYRRLFSTVLTRTSDCVYALDLDEGRQAMRISRPVVQQQPHRLDYSAVDGKFRPMVLGPESVLWGIQYAYPQLYQDQATQEILQVNDGPNFPNTPLFRGLQKWVRHNTIPTPFKVNGQKINVPMRLGKKCLSWINNHPQLVKKGIVVESGSQ